MIAALKQRVTVGPGGVVEVRSDQLRPGDEAEVIVLVEPTLGESQADADDPPKSAEPDSAEEGESVYDMLHRLGLNHIIGGYSNPDGPTDLSTNPKHMEGFGK